MKKSDAGRASVRSAQQNDITQRLTQPTRQNRHFSKKNYGLVFDHHDHHHAQDQKEETQVSTKEPL